MIDLSVIIVNYNVREFLEQALRSVARASAGLAVEVFVVDNNSVDGSVEMVRTVFPDVHLIANEENVGFGVANNQAVRQAQGRYLLILNPDTIVQEDTFTALVRFMDAHPEAGAVGCKILNPDGTFAPESRRAFPTPAVAFYRIAGLSRLFPKSPTFGRYNMTYLPDDAVAEVDALSGSCMMVRQAALYQDYGAAAQPGAGGPSSDPDPAAGAGLFDEAFFMYGEDLDWCYRIQQAGWKIYYMPETQIIHYKGESTKKGELRYVRHFYGAMLLFTQKHFQGRYSMLFAAGLRLAIMVRAGLTVAANALQRMMAPAVDFVLVFAVVTLVGYAYSSMLGSGLQPLFLASVAPGYALGTVVALWLAGGYRRGQRLPLRTALIASLAGLAVVATAAFFIKEIAFSRVIVALSFPPIVALLLLWRRLWHGRKAGLRRALIVGHAAEAMRLRHLLDHHPRPPFVLEGYLTPDEPAAPPSNTLPHLGTLRHLRDLVRLRHIDDVVFAADDLSHRTIFRLMQQLHNLPVQFRMLGEGREHVIGKASIADLSAPALLDTPLAPPRSLAARRALEIPVAVIGMLLHPFIALLARWAGPSSFLARLANRTRQLPAVVRGQKMLIGYHHAEAFHPPEEWRLGPGVFSITDTLGPHHNEHEIGHAYWFYVSHQSTALDLDILRRALHALRHPHQPLPIS